MADKTGYIGRNPGDSAVTVARQFFTASGVTTAFTFASGYLTGYLDIYVDGVKKRVADEFTATDGSTFDVLQGGVGAGSTVEAVAYKAFNATTVSGDITGNFDVSGNTTLGGSLDIVGGTTLTNLVVTGISTLGTGTTVGFANTAFNLGGTPNISVDLLSAVDINVSGAATIGGVLTYEDVTNIDSIGIVTARTGVEVTANGLVVNAGVGTFAADVSIADKIVHTGDTNTAIRFPSPDTFTIETTGIERVRVDSTGDVGLVGIATATGLVVVAGSGIYAGHTGVITATSFDGSFVGNITGAASQVTVADESSDTTCFPLFTTAATGDLPPKSGTNLTFNSSSGALTATSFVGALTGAVTGNSDTATTATTSTNVTVADESSDTTCFPLFATAATGNLPPKSGTNLTFNSSTGALTATSFVGALTGNVTGNVTGNISGGTVAGSTGTFTGDVDIADKIIHTGDTNTAIRFPAADTFTVETAGTERLRIDSSGNVGINETSPETHLHVEQDNAHSSTYYTNADAAILLQNNNTGASAKTVLKLEAPPSSSDCAIVYGGGTTNLIFSDRQNERLRITSAGRLGINQSTPQTTFHSTGTTNGQQATFGIDDSGLKISTFQKTDNDAGVILDAQKSSNGTLTFATAGTERLRIDSSGNGNFGAVKAVALPSGTGIQVYNSSTPRIKLVNDTTGNASGDGSYLYVSGSDFLIENKESANMRFYTSATEQLRIDSAGKVGININNPGSYNSAGNELVLGNTGNNGGMTIVSGTGNNGHIFFADGTSAPNQGIIKYEHANDQMAFNIATAEKLRITSAGITVTGTVTDSSGDLRITPILGKSSDYTLVVTDTGKTIVRTGGNITVPSSMTAGMIVTIINNANSTTTITAGATLRFTDSTTGNRTLAAYGVATVTYISASSAYITGTGLS